MPPSAAPAGKMAWRTVHNSPSTNSRLISRPTRKKNTAIHSSFTHTSKGLDSTSALPPMRNSPGICKNRS
jgi:hypothetical protein